MPRSLVWTFAERLDRRAWLRQGKDALLERHREFASSPQEVAL